MIDYVNNGKRLSHLVQLHALWDGGILTELPIEGSCLVQSALKNA